MVIFPSSLRYFIFSSFSSFVLWIYFICNSASPIKVLSSTINTSSLGSRLIYFSFAFIFPSLSWLVGGGILCAVFFCLFLFIIVLREFISHHKDKRKRRRKNRKRQNNNNKAKIIRNKNKGEKIKIREIWLRGRRLEKEAAVNLSANRILSACLLLPSLPSNLSSPLHSILYTASLDFFFLMSEVRGGVDGGADGIREWTKED